MGTPAFTDLLAAARRSAAHLELRDGYMQSDPVFVYWQRGVRFGVDSLPESCARWHGLVGDARGRGVEVLRARIVSEPVSEYIRFEYEITEAVNVAAGEQVRWLPRARASELALPGNDCWIFDDETVQFGIFSGDGEVVDHMVTTDPAVVKLCVDAFAAVWDRATPHEEYRPA